MGRSIGKIDKGIPIPIMPTENVGIMSGAIRGLRKAKGIEGEALANADLTLRRPKYGKDLIPRDKRGSSPDVQLGRVTQPDGSTLITYGSSPRRKERGGSIGRRRGYPAIRPDGKGIKEPPAGMKYDEADRLVPIDKPRFDPSKPSAVQETTRVNVQDPTLGGPPEREVPLPKEKDMTPRGPAPFAPDEGDVAKQRFFETMFERASNRKERSVIDKGEMRDRQEARRDEAMMRDSEMGGRRRGRRDFTRRRPERRRSREERAAFRDRYVSTLGSNFFS